MPIQVTCPACSAEFRTSEANAGKRGKCPKCGAAVLVPEPDGPEAELRAERTRPQRPQRAQRRSSRRSSSTRGELGNVEDLPSDALPPLAVGGAIGAAVLGAALWSFVAYKFNYEIGWIAWGIGALVGAVAVKLGGRGAAMGATAAVLTLLGIAAGKYVSIELSRNNAVDEILAEGTSRTVYSQITSDAKNFAKLPEDASDEAVAHFMETHEYPDPESSVAPTAEDIAEFRAYSAPMLTSFHASPPAFETWRDESTEIIRASIEPFLGSTKDLFLEGLGGMSLFFAALGIATAWSLVTRASG